MPLDGDHDVIEVPCTDEAGAFGVLGLERHRSVFVMKVVEELRELAEGDNAVLLFPEVEFAEVRVEREREAPVQSSLPNNAAELICNRFVILLSTLDQHLAFYALTVANGAVAVGVEQLEGCPVEGIGNAKETLKGLELLEGDEPTYSAYNNLIDPHLDYVATPHGVNSLPIFRGI